MYHRLNTEKKNLTVTFSDSIKSTDIPPPPPPCLSSHTHKTCPTMPCPPTPADTAKSDQPYRSADHLLSIYRTLQEGEMDSRGIVRMGEVKDQGEGVATVVPVSPSNLNWVGHLQAGIANPGYVYHSTPTRDQVEESQQIADSAFIRTRYEWGEPNTPSTLTSLPTDKYRGDYERDPSYMAHVRLCATASLPDNTVSNGLPLPRGRAATEHAQMRTDKYRGDYERCETYVFSPLSPMAMPTTPTSSTTSTGEKASTSSDQPTMSCDQPTTSCAERTREFVGGGKYRGDYERSPVYMQHLLKTQSVSCDSCRGYVQDISTQ